MCSNPITQDGKTFACRTCNNCIKARKNDWIARCMAEKETSNETLVFGLTYRNNVDGTLPDGARALRYKDVQDFIKRLREDYYRKYGERGEIRYVIAGERGSKTDRVHWHFVLFSDRPVSILGEWSDFLHKPIKSMKLEKMVHWSYWPHGHLKAQIPDQGGMAYVIKYILKDQFNIVKSKGTMRFSKSENHGASMFRMSKKPPIAQRWLEKKCNEWERRGIIPIRLDLKIPEYSGYWWPKGDQREYLIQRLHEINEGVKIKTGKDAPQWSALLSTVVNNIKDWEGLHYGQTETESEEYTQEYWEKQLAEKQVARLRSSRAKQTRYRCGGALICKPCWRGKTRKEKARYRTWYEQQQAEHDRTDQSKKTDLNGWYRQKGQINPFCGLKEANAQKEAFGTKYKKG